MVVFHNQFWCLGCYIIICIFLVDWTKWIYWWIKLQVEIHWSKIVAENLVEGVTGIDAEALFGVEGEAIKVKKGGERWVEEMWGRGRGRKERHGMFWCFLSWMLCFQSFFCFFFLILKLAITRGRLWLAQRHVPLAPKRHRSAAHHGTKLLILIYLSWHACILRLTTIFQITDILHLSHHFLFFLFLSDIYTYWSVYQTFSL